jgi:YVTN family beta-propeller protein
MRPEEDAVVLNDFVVVCKLRSMKPGLVGRAAHAAAAVVFAATLSACPGPTTPSDAGTALAQVVFVAHESSVVSYDLETGNERPGTVTDVVSPTDVQALEDGTVIVNLTGRNEVLAIDGKTMVQSARLASSDTGATRPVHGYLTPERSGRRYWVALNDGASFDAGTNSARFIGAKAGGGDYLKAKGEVNLGKGHHKATFSNTKERAIFSNIGDCDNVLGVYDYSNIADIKTLKTFSAADFGWDGGSFAQRCDQTFTNGVPPSPHGCATSKVNGKAFCNLTGSGDIVQIELDADPPTSLSLKTKGSGGGYTKASKDGKYIYSVQESPREGDVGAAVCQVGQLVTVDAATATIVSQVSLLNEGPGCTTVLLGTDEATAAPGHIVFTKDSKTMFVTLAGGFGVASARTRQELVIDLTNPAAPVQKASIPVGASTSHHGDALTGDGKYLLVTNNVDGTVTQIDTATLTVVKTITVKAKPNSVATFGTVEGPSAQTGPIE